MAYRINSYVEEQNHTRCHAPERHYIKELESRGGLLRLDNVLVDAEQMILRRFLCDPNWCMRCSGEGSAKVYKGSCCTDLQVDLTKPEIGRLKMLGEMALARLTFPSRDPLNDVAKRLSSGNFIEETEKGELAIRHTRNGRCPVSWMDRDGTMRCGINSFCLALELPLGEYKPDPCYLFPLHYVEYEPGVYFVTVVSQESHEWVGADAYVSKLRCLSKPKPGAPPAYLCLKSEIIHCFGQNLYESLAEAAGTILERSGRMAVVPAQGGGTVKGQSR